MEGKTVAGSESLHEAVDARSLDSVKSLVEVYRARHLSMDRIVAVKLLPDRLASDKVVRHAGYVVFQMAEVAVPRELFVKILERIGRLRLESG